jgi:reelin
MNAQMIEFDAAACLYPGTTSTIKFQLAYSTDNGTTYKTAKIFTVERGGPGAHAIVTINDAMNGSAVHLQIKQISSFSGKESQAWALDNFVVMGQRTQTITEDFNGGTACNIIERSSSDVKPYCSSPSDALIFSGKATSSIGHFATSVPVMVTHTGIIPESTGDVFSEEFETIPSIPGKKWASIAGGHISIPECGAIDSTGAGYAAYFNETGLQSIETESLDLVDARSLFFKIRFRGGSKCGSSVSNTTSIVVEYQVQKNTPFIQLLQLNSHEYMVATTVNVTIPSTAQTNLTVLRWRKISNSGLDSDVWAIDHVSIPHFYEEIEAPGKDKVIFSEHFDKIPTIGGAKWASIWGGAFLTPDCGSIDLPGFSSQAAYFQQHGTRSIQTQSLDLSQAITLSFRVRIGGSYGSSCESADPNEDVVVEYRPAGSHSFRQLKLLAYNAYLTATTVVISLPVAAQTTATAIRWRQLSNSGLYTDEWAIDAISIIAIISSPTAITKPVAALTLTTIFSDNFDTTPKIPGNYWRAMSGGTFTTPVCGSIDLPGFSSRAAFFSYSGSRYIQTVSLDLTSAQTVSFRILIGGENSYSSCENADSGESVVLEYSTANSSSFTEILTLQYFAYRNATTVTVAIPFAAKSVSTALQWRQLSNSGSSFDEWALDHVDIKGYAHSSGSPLTTIFMEDFDPTPLFPGTRWQTISAGSIKTPDCGSIDLPGFSSKAAVFHYYGSRYIQTSPLNLIYARTLSFRIQIGGGSWLCRDAGYGEDVVVEYQISGSSTFSQLYLLRYYEYRSAQTVTIAVPTSVKTENTVLRWRQLSNSGYYEDVWAIDHIQITGSTPAPWSYIFSEDFFPLPTFGGTKWLSIHGGTVAIPNCGAIDLPSYSAEAAFFYDGGVRSIQTQALNLVLAEMLSFRVQIGGGYGCVAADVGQDVVVEYQAQGSPVFHQITKLKYDGYEIAKTVTVPIPTAARTNATYIRWKQLSNFTGNYNQYGIGKWALDHVRITWSAENQPSVVEFQLCMGCNSPYFHQQSASYDIQLEYSVDYGQTWDLVEECQQSSYMCTQTMVSSQYSSFLFKQWRRLVVLLPFLAISNNTEIRWRQSSSATGIEWAIDNIYIGVRCPRFCNGHGHCTKPNGQYQGLVCGGNSDGNPCAKSFTYNGETYHGCTRDGREGIDNQLWCSTTTDFDNDRKWGYCVCGICQCDSGYSGVACEKTNQALPQVLSELFEDELSTSKWAWVAGGSIDTTCGTIGSGNSMIFNLGRTRLLESTDLNLTQSYSLQFTAQVGSSKVGCPRPTESKNNIFIQYSINGGVTWNLMQIIPFFFGTSPAQQNVVIPNAAKTPSTRIRWYQASASGSNLDVWAIDDVYIDAVLSSLPVVETFDPSSSFMWRSLTGSKVERYCSSTSDTLHFSQSSATHGFARTVSLHLTQATYIQFDIVVDCGQTLPSSAAYVTLQYSTDSGKRWWRLDDGCLPHSFSCASLRRPSVYRSGLYSTWKRVTILLNDTHLASMPAAVVQLQWLGNKASIAYDWAIDNVYIGEGCPGVCSGHGRCTSKGTCACDVGYKNSQCSSYDGTRPRQIKEQFDHVIPSSLSVTGGSISDDCGVLSAGTALTFNLAGEREIVTSEMDATNVHYIQFVYMTGSLSGAGTGCTAVRSSSQVPIVDYSIDGGVTWTTLEVLRYYDYTQTSAGINIRIPMAAQTRATYFRLWQYNFYSSDSATWTLDDLFIGGYTPGNGSTLFETFSPLKASNWLFYPSGRVVNGKCSAQTPALYFDGTGEGQQYATTKPFALQVDPYQLISVPFDSSLPIG